MAYANKSLGFLQITTMKHPHYLRLKRYLISPWLKYSMLPRESGHHAFGLIILVFLLSIVVS